MVTLKLNPFLDQELAQMLSIWADLPSLLFLQ